MINSAREAASRSTPLARAIVALLASLQPVESDGVPDNQATVVSDKSPIGRSIKLKNSLQFLKAGTGKAVVEPLLFEFG